MGLLGTSWIPRFVLNMVGKRRDAEPGFIKHLLYARESGWEGKKRIFSSRGGVGRIAQLYSTHGFEPRHPTFVILSNPHHIHCMDNKTKAQRW